MARSAAAALPCDRDLPGCRTKPQGAGGTGSAGIRSAASEGYRSTESRRIGPTGSGGSDPQRAEGLDPQGATGSDPQQKKVHEIRAGTRCPEVTGGSQQRRDTQTGVLGNELRSGRIQDQRYRCTQLELGRDSELGMPVHPQLRSGGIQGWECRCTPAEVRKMVKIKHVVTMATM